MSFLFYAVNWVYLAQVLDLWCRLAFLCQTRPGIAARYGIVVSISRERMQYTSVHVRVCDACVCAGQEVAWDVG